MMVLLLKYEAPDQMPHLCFKNNHSFLCKSLLKCNVSDLFYDTFWHVGDKTKASKGQKLKFSLSAEEVSL